MAVRISWMLGMFKYTIAQFLYPPATAVSSVPCPRKRFP